MAENRIQGLAELVRSYMNRSGELLDEEDIGGDDATAAMIALAIGRWDLLPWSVGEGARGARKAWRMLDKGQRAVVRRFMPEVAEELEVEMAARH